MVSDDSDFEDMPVDDEQLEVAEEKQTPVKKGYVPKGRPPIGKPKQPLPVQEEGRPGQNRYIAVHQTAMDGIIDTFDNNKTVSTDIWDMLAKIYNKLEAIERAVGV